MSLHRQSQFQRAHRQEMADSCRSPLLLSGDICPYLLATGWSVAFSAAPRPVNRPLSPSPIRVNNLFAILFQKLFDPPGEPLTRRTKWGRNRGIQGLCRAPGKWRRFGSTTGRWRKPADKRAELGAHPSSNIDSTRGFYRSGSRISVFGDERSGDSAFPHPSHSRIRIRRAL